MTIHAFTDGASRGNPGESGIGVILKDEKGNVLKSLFGYIGTTTNNAAEYTALITCLQVVSKMECRDLVVYSDSELMVRQMEGKYKVREPRLKRYVQEARGLISTAPFQCKIRHVTRDRNKEADHLANLGIDSKQPVHMSNSRGKVDKGL
jgi:ribonuclease HI